MPPVAALRRVVPKYCRKFLLPYQFRSIIFNGYEDLSAMAPYDTRCALLVVLPLFQPLLIVANGRISVPTRWFAQVGYTEVAEVSAGQVPGVEVASDGLRQQGRPCAHI